MIIVCIKDLLSLRVIIKTAMNYSILFVGSNKTHRNNLYETLSTLDHLFLKVIKSINSNL